MGYLTDCQQDALTSFINGCRYIYSGYFFYPPLDTIVEVTVRRNSRNFTARWKEGRVAMSIPPMVEEQHFRKALEELTPRLIKRRSSLKLYEINQKIELEGYSFVIANTPEGSDNSGVTCSYTRTCAVIYVPRYLSVDDPHVVEDISSMMCRVANRVAGPIIIPRAKQLAKELKANPGCFTMSRGKRTLGRCDSRGVISLSSVLLFLPPELRDYVICHELAHLSELNHSDNFYCILNDYLGDREIELSDKLRHYRWPIMR